MPVLCTQLSAAAAPVAALTLLACGSSPAPAKEPTPPATPEEIVAYHDSRQWARDTERAIDRAKRFVTDNEARYRRPAIVLDIDDTSLSGYECLRAAGFERAALGECGREAAMPAIVPTRRLYALARRRGVTVFFITGRREDMRAASVQNLRAEGFRGRLRITMRPAGPRRGSNAQYKARARRRIERRGYRILVNVGDQRTDLANGHALRQIKLPNPMYLSK